MIIMNIWLFNKHIDMNILQETYHIVETIKMTDTKEKQKWFYLLRSEWIDSYFISQQFHLSIFK